MGAPIAAVPKRAGRTVGRPRLLTRDQVVEAALALGLDQFSMKRVAEHLGVGIATLYEYVGSRDDLLRLAVDLQFAQLPLPVDHGQHWSDYIAEYARAVQDLLAAHPHAIVQFLDAGFGLDIEVQIAEQFLQAMVARGFSIEQGVRILRAVGHVAMGAAVGVCRARAIRVRGASTAQKLDETFVHFDPAELPLLRAGAAAYSEPVADLVSELVRPLIESIARERGEALPEAPQ